MAERGSVWMLGVLAVVLIVACICLIVLALSCSGPGARKVASTVEIGYGQGWGSLGPDTGRERDLDIETQAAWVSVRPLAALEPEPSWERPLPTYAVPAPPAPLGPPAPVPAPPTVYGVSPKHTELALGALGVVATAIVGWFNRHRIPGLRSHRALEP